MTEPDRHDPQRLKTQLLQSPNTQNRSIGGGRIGPSNVARNRINPVHHLQWDRRWDCRNLEIGDDDRWQLDRRLRHRRIWKCLKIDAARFLLVGFAIAVRTAVGISVRVINNNLIFKEANAQRHGYSREKYPEASQQYCCNCPSHGHKQSQIVGRVKVDYWTCCAGIPNFLYRKRTPCTTW